MKTLPMEEMVCADLEWEVDDSEGKTGEAEGEGGMQFATLVQGEGGAFGWKA